MTVFKTLDKIGDLKRFKDIVSVLFEEGFAYLFDKAKLRFLVPIECRIRCFLKACVGMWDRKPPEDLPVRLKRVLIKLGPTFVKFGQVLSLRPDIIPPDIAKELEKLASEVPPMKYEEVKNIVESELGSPIAKLFKNFEKDSIGAASLAQVHKATLWNGTKVAVKVQRPGIAKVIEKDIHIMLYIARMVEEKLPDFAVFSPVEVIKEFAETIARELDFTIEAIHAKRFLQMFEDTPSIKVSKIYDEYSTKKVLTMDLIEGIRVNDDTGLKKAKIDKKILAQNGVNAFLRQVFVEGFFHADPHPGNYFALPGNVFAFIDYGMVGRMSPKQRMELASLFISFLNEDAESAIEHVKHMVRITQGSNVPSFDHDIDDTLHQWFGAKLGEVNLSQTFFRIIDSGRRNKIFFPSSFAYLAKTIYTTEAMGLKLDPDFDLATQMKPFIKEIIRSELSPKRIKQMAEDKALDYISLVQSLPETTVSLLEKINKGELSVKISPEELKELRIQFVGENVRRLGVLVFAATVLSISVMYALERGLFNLHLNITTIGLILILSVAFYLFTRRET